MKKTIYEDGSFSFETSNGAVISDSSIRSLDELLTDTRFEKFHYLCNELCFDDVDANEVLNYLEMIKDIETKGKIKLDLSKVDGNAYSIMGAFQQQALSEGWSKEQISYILDLAKSGDYDHLVSTISRLCER